MATTKVGVYRSYRGPVPLDEAGVPVPKSEWPKKRLFSWVVRWFDIERRRYSESFSTRREAELFAESKQKEVREGKATPPPRATLRQFYDEHKVLMKGSFRSSTLKVH